MCYRLDRRETPLCWTGSDINGGKRAAQKFFFRKLLSLALAVLLAAGTPAVKLHAQEDGNQEAAVQLSAPAALLMEASTGTVVYEKNADVPCSPASITKIMTLLLIFEALEKGDIRLEDEVMTSAHAQSMGRKPGVSGRRGNRQTGGYP